MVDPVSRISPSTPPSEVESSTPYSPQEMPSTLSSLEEPPGLIVSFFTAIISFFNWIFNLNPPPSPEIDLSLAPGELSESDPFRNKIFNFSPRKYELACSIFQTLGAGGPWHWLKNRWQLERWEKELISMPGDPFEFLFFLTHSQTMIQAMLSFKKIAISSSENGICYLLGRKPWSEFIAKQTESFILRGNPEMIPGFCQILRLDEATVSSLYHSQKWEELIDYILHEREKLLAIS